MSRLHRAVRSTRFLAGLTSVAVAGAGLLWVAAPASASSSPCTDGSTPDLLSTVSCSAAGNYTLTVPPGTTDVDADVIGGGGGAGYPARSHIGGNAAEVSGNLTLPAGTAYLYVIVGVGGSGDNHGSGIGGGASAVLAEDSGHNLLAKLAIAGAGGSGAYNGDGGNAGSAGTSENTTLSTGGSPGIGATGGSGGSGNYSAGSAGGTNNPATLTVAAGGNGGGVPGGAYGGGGGGGYGGGGGGGGGTNGILTRNVSGGAGGSSLASAYLGAASISIASGTGGVQLPGLVAGDGSTGTVTLTFNGLAVPGAPTGASATAGNGQASVSFTAPTSDGGSPITSYTVTSSPGGVTKTCPGSPCVVTGLTDGMSYTFTVHATNANGDSPESSASAAVTPATLPGAPTGASATAGDGQASVSFTAPAFDGGSAITSYTVTSAPGGLSATCPGSPCVVTGLTNGTSYTFTVHATNTVGDSAESSASAAVTPVGAPNAPTTVTATPGDQKIKLSFPVPGDGGKAITGYQVSVDGGQTWQTLDTTVANGTVTGSVGGLIDGVTYSVEVRAVNSEGPGDASAAQDVTPATTPDAPTGASAVRGDGSAQVSFTAPVSDGGSAITSYTVTSSPGGLTATCTGSPCTITGLANGTSYTFTVVATNDAGSSAPSAASNAVTPATVPGAPGSFTVKPSNGAAKLSFTAPDNGGSPVTGYEYTTDGGSTWQTLTTSGTAPITATVGNLSNGTVYSFEVRSVNSVGAGAATAPVLVTPATTPDAPTGVNAVAGPERASVSFTAPMFDGGSAITSYTVTSSPGGLTATCPGSPCEVTGLNDGTAYTFTVTATNAVGDSAASSASGAITPATVPGTPSNLHTSATADSIAVSFTAPADNGSPITGYEFSTDGGMTWHTLDVSTNGSDVTGTITALSPSTAYPVLLRAVNAVGAGTALDAGTVTTVPATPAAPTATAGRASATISWTKTTDDTVTGYTVTANPGPASCTTTSADDTSCIIGAVSGTAYTYTVIANSPAGASAASAASNSVTANEPVVPAAAPTDAPTTLTTTDGVLTSVQPGQRITLLGKGFLPYSSVTVIMYSDPTVLGTAVTDGDGTFTKEIVVPADLAAGQHNLVASGVDSTGAVRLMRMPVTVAAAAGGTGGGTTGGGTTGGGTTGGGSGGSISGGSTSGGTTSGGSSTSTGGLAYTGAELFRIALWAALLSGAGLVLVSVGRRGRDTV